MHSGLSEYCDSLRRLALAEDGKNAALQGVVDFVIGVISHQSSIARVFSSRVLDHLCLDIGRTIAGDLAAEPDGDNGIVYLVSSVAPTGGHSRVLLDLIASEQADKQSVIISHVIDGMEGPTEFLSESGVAVHVAPAGDLAAKVRFIAERLADIAPRKTYMLPHHFDAVLMAAAQPAITGQLIYLHNCDHALALGVHLPHATHVDFHAKGLLRCRGEIGTDRSYLVPLTARDQGSRTDAPFMVRGHVTSCTSGGFEKFSNQHYLERIPYDFRYEDVILELLTLTRGTHVHIGRLSDDMLEQIRRRLDAIDLQQDRFQYIEFVPDLWQALLEWKIDLYFGSFPYGGGRATVEAMGAGLPLLIHSNYRSEFLSVEFEVYPGAMIWASLDDLRRHVARLDAAVLQRHARLSRAYYDTRHTSACLLDALARIERGAPPPTPLGYSYRPDALRDFLDRHPQVIPRSD